MPIISGSIRERASKDDVPLDCRTLHGLGFPCTLQLPSVHEASWLSAYVRVKHTPREPHQGCPQACVDTARMLLFLGLLCTPCSNGWPRSIGRAVLSRCTDAGRGGRVSRSRHHARHNIEAARKPAGCHRDQESCERCALPACDPSQLSAVIMPAEKLHLRGRADHC